MTWAGVTGVETQIMGSFFSAKVSHRLNSTVAEDFRLKLSPRKKLRKQPFSSSNVTGELTNTTSTKVQRTNRLTCATVAVDKPLSVTKKENKEENTWTRWTDQEVMRTPHQDVCVNHPSIDVRMRAIVVGWMHDIITAGRVCTETLIISVNIFDRYLSLSRTPVHKNKLQLFGATALFIASKYEDIYPLKMEDFIYSSDNCFTANNMINAEILILNTLQCKLTRSSSLACVAWLELQATTEGHAIKCTVGDITTEKLSKTPNFRLGNVTHYLCTLALLVPELIGEPATRLAAAIFVVVHGENTLPNVVDGYTPAVLQKTITQLLLWHTNKTSNTEVIRIQKVFTPLFSGDEAVILFPRGA
jgi:hypothetical protein